MKVYKSNNKLAINVPFEVIKGLDLKEDDEVDFFRYSEKAFLFSKKSDVASMLMGKPAARDQSAWEAAREPSPREPEKRAPAADISDSELAVLKVLDTLRYKQRTIEEVGKRLNAREKEILQGLIKKKAVVIFPANGSGGVYSIAKTIYDRFLMRKGKKPQPHPQSDITGPVKAEPRQHLSVSSESDLSRELKSAGFVVVTTEAEAAALSLTVEESIRRGQILGTRAFNRKFYISTRWFFNKHNDRILKSIGEGKGRVADIAKDAGLKEDGARAILYLLSEYGDVREKRRDFFAPA